MASTLLIYGATGYTGELIVREAVKRGLRPILAARTEKGVAALAKELNVEYRVFSLEDSQALDAGLSRIDLVLNCAGPFSITAEPLARACIRVGAHYLDLAGEVPEFQRMASLDEAARVAGVMLMPGVGFGVVPSDSLALHLKTRLPSAKYLSLAFHAIGGVSRGTTLTLLKDLPNAGVVRRDGKLIPAYAGEQTRRIQFGKEAFTASTNPWRGDIFTAYYSTAIPNIKTYIVFPTALRLMLRVRPVLAILLRSSQVQNLLKRQMQGQPAGPSQQERQQGRTLLWGEAIDETGNKVVSQLFGPEAYDYTVLTALLIAERVMDGELQAGFHTPTQVYGSDFVLSLPGVTRIDE